MKFAIGIDLENTAEFANLSREDDNTFLTNVFTEQELEYCFGKKNPSQHLTARFAAKEATYKAIEQISTRCRKQMTEIEVYKKKGDNPPKLIIDNFNSYDSSLSMSHTKSAAIAVVQLLDTTIELLEYEGMEYE